MKKDNPANHNGCTPSGAADCSVPAKPEKRLYEVAFTVRAVVLAASRCDAFNAANEDWYEIRGDNDPDVDVVREIDRAEDLPSGWDVLCLPYGGDGETRISALLPMD